MALPAGRYGVTKNQLLRIKKLPMNTIKLIEELTEKFDLLGSAAFKNSTSVVTDSSDLVESGAVYDALGFGNKNLLDANDVTLTAYGDIVPNTVIDLKSGTYTLSFDVSGTIGSTKAYNVIDRSTGSNVVLATGTLVTGRNSITFTTETPITVFRSYTDNNSTLTFSNIQVEKGTTATAYEPYHASVEETMRDAQFIQGKNYLPNDITTQTVNGITFAVQEDGTVIANGTASADWARVYFANNTYLPVGNYLLSGVTGGATTTYRITLEMSDGTSVTVFDGNTAFTITEGKYINKAAILIRQAGYVANNVVFKPMVRKATESDPTYEPYYTPLKDVVPTKADNSVIGTVEGANASKAWSVGEHFISGGQFKEVTQAIASGGAISDSNTVDKPIADCLVYKAGDSIVYNSAGDVAGSFIGNVSSNRKAIHIFINTDKPIIANSVSLNKTGDIVFLVNNISLAYDSTLHNISISILSGKQIRITFTKKDGTEFNATALSVLLSFFQLGTFTFTFS